MDSSEVQKANVPFEKVVTPSGITTELRLEHPQKVVASVVTPDGIVIESSPVQSMNAPPSKAVIPSGKETDVIPLHEAKASTPIEVTGNAIPMKETLSGIIKWPEGLVWPFQLLLGHTTVAASPLSW